MKYAPSSPFQSIMRHLVVGIVVVALAIFGVGGWAATTELSGAVIASGFLVVETSVKKVQHPTGGVVKEILVQEGSHVKAGDILVRLDQTQTKVADAIVSKSLDELVAQQARLEAERDGDDHITFPKGLTERAAHQDAEVVRVMLAEQKLFALRRQSQDGRKAQLRERITQLNEQIQGFAGQVDAKAQEIKLIQSELEGVRELWKTKLVPLTRLNSLERDAARIQGERSQLIGAIAEAKGKITETQLQIIQVDQDLRTEVAKDLAETRSKVSEFVERKVAAADQLKRTDIRAPQDGIVKQLSVHTVGGVVAAGDTLMLIVPNDDALTVEARIAPQDIDQIYLGQQASLRFTAFNQRTTPEIEGKVTLVSADVTQDPKTGAAYYLVHITPDASAPGQLGDVKLVPGMPVDSFIKTGERTMISYLTKPLRDQIERAFREK